MKKKMLNQRTFFCVCSFIILLIVVISARNVSGSIIYVAKNSDNKFQFCFENLIYGNTKLTYLIDNPETKMYFTQGTNIRVSGVIEQEIHTTPIAIMSLILALTIGLGSIAISIFIPNVTTRKWILIGLSLLLIISSILFFTSSVFLEKLMKNIANELFGGTSIESEYKNCEINGIVARGIWIIVCAVITLGSAFIKENKPKNDLKSLDYNEVKQIE